MNLVLSEWEKLRTTRATWVVLVAGFAVEMLILGLVTAFVNRDDLGDDLTVFYSLTNLAPLFVLTLGVLSVTNEFRHGTASSTFLVTPRRERVVAAKFVVILLVTLVAGVVAVAVNAAIISAVLDARSLDRPTTDDLTPILIGTVLVSGLSGILGVGLGATIRNQVLALVVGIVGLSALGALFFALPDSIVQFLPGQAQASLTGLDFGDGAGGANLSQLMGGIVFAAYGVVLTAIGSVIVASRDVSA